MAAGLAMTAAALAAATPAPAPALTPTDVPTKDPARERHARVVSAPVRIADAATVRLLQPGDRVDVIAAANSPTGSGPDARVVATGARVTAVPGSREGFREGVTDDGALIVLTVPRATAAALAGAGATSRLAVTLC